MYQRSKLEIGVNRKVNLVGYQNAQRGEEMSEVGFLKHLQMEKL